MPAFSVMANDEETHSHDGWTEWSNGNAMPSAAGSYYLTADVTLTAEWGVPVGTTNLCLNGHIIRQTQSAGVISVPNGAAFNLYDENNQGQITGGSKKPGAEACTLKTARHFRCREVKYPIMKLEKTVAASETWANLL